MPSTPRKRSRRPSEPGHPSSACATRTAAPFRPRLPTQPFVGTSGFAHKGGMHTHAVARVTKSYEHIDPALVGNERRILVSELSGQSTILAKTTKYDINHDRALMVKILTRVQDLENE